MTTVLQEAQLEQGNGTVHVLPTGPLPPNPAELLGSQSVKDLIGELRAHADYVLIDSPPVLPVADPLVLSSYADGIIFVVGADRLRRKQFDRAMTLITQAKAPMLGFVLNGVSTQGSYYHYDQSYYASHPTSDVTVTDVASAEVDQPPAESAPEDAALNTEEVSLAKVKKPRGRKASTKLVDEDTTTSL